MMDKLKRIYGAIKRFFVNRWFLFGVVALFVTVFAIWYGAWWTLLVALPLVYDYFITRKIRAWHHAMLDKHRWWRIGWGVWCALVFALVVGVIIQMVVFRWNIPFIVTFIAVFAFALWSEFKRMTRAYRWVYGWVHAILFATVVATLIQLYWFQMFVIPTGSMESTLMAGDYILVNKVAYGPRVPMTPLSFPFVHNILPFSDNKPSFSTAWERSYRRLSGTDNVKRGDVVVFNFPEGDTVILERANESYYQILRDPREQSYGKTEQERREYILNNYTIAIRPLDKKENYIKRCVAVAGDTFAVRDGVVYVGDEAEEYIPAKQYIYDVYNKKNGGVQRERLLRDDEVGRYSDTTLYRLVKRGDSPNNTLGERGLNYALIPHLASGESAGWTLDNFGPVWVPKAGDSIELNDETIAMYGRCITAYEHRSLKIERSADGVVYYIDGEPATHYTFLMDYYFMMGDNRHASLDSRFWGFVPEDHIVGRASYVWFSRDPETGDIRWDRMFKSIE